MCLQTLCNTSYAFILLFFKRFRVDFVLYFTRYIFISFPFRFYFYQNSFLIISWRNMLNIDYPRRIAIRICKLKKDRQNNGQKKKDKRTKNDLQNITHYTKDRVTRIPLKPRCSGRMDSSCATSDTRANTKKNKA